MAELVRVVAGVALLVAPGVAVAWAVFPRLDGPKFALLSVLTAFTVPPAVLFVIVRVFGATYTPLLSVSVAAGVAVAAAAVGAWRRYGLPPVLARRRNV